MIRKLEDIILYRDERFYSAFPAVTRRADGRLVVAFRRAPEPRWLLGAAERQTHPDLADEVCHCDARSQLVTAIVEPDLTVSREPLALPVDPLAADQDASLLTLADGTLLLASFAWRPVPAAFLPALRPWPLRLYGDPETSGCVYMPWGGFVRRSRDGGASFTAHEYLPPLPGAGDIVPGRRPWHGGAVRGQPVEVDGEILLPTYGLVPARSPTHSAHTYASADGGKTWRYRGPVAADPDGKLHFYEPALCRTAAGRVVAFHRTGAADGRLATSESADGGRSFAPWRLHDVVGHPFHPLVLPDGRVLLTYGYRDEPFGIRARLLDPACADPSGAKEFILRADGAGADLGYPWAAALPGGEILVAYYFCAGDGIRHIAATLIEVS